jgi:hypothetical protein
MYRYALPAWLFCRPPPRRRVAQGKNAPAEVFFKLAGRDAIVYCKIQKFGTFYPFKSHFQGKFFEIVALNYSLYQN